MSSEYTGVANLEIMEAARNYNCFLADLVLGSLVGARSCVDYGAGTGTIARLVAARGMHVICVEPDRRLRERLLLDGFVAHASLTELPPESIDAGYSLNVLEHIEDDVSALRELHGRLRRGAPCLIYVPAFPLLFSVMDRFLKHVRRYSRRELRDKVGAAGFEVKQIEYADSIGFFAALAYKVMPRGEGRLSVGPVIAYDRFVFPFSRMLDSALKHVLGKNVFVVAHRR